MSLAQLHEVPTRNLILLIGPPGSGKSTFCEQTILHSFTFDRPVIYVTTEYDPSKAEEALREKGLGRVKPGLLNYVDAYNETVGISISDRPDTIHADCNDLSSIDIAISKLTGQLGREGILLVFDSLTSPYLFNGVEILRFLRQTLSRFSARRNAVLACIDEGCGKEEDLVAMMSLADGVIKIEMEDNMRHLNVVKHPKVSPTRIEVPMTPSIGLDSRIYDPDLLKQFTLAMMKGEETTTRRESGDYVNLFWPNLVHWSGMLWDPKRFPMMTYELNKDDYPSVFRLSKTDKEFFRIAFPWRFRLMLKLIMPQSLSKVKDMEKVLSRRSKTLMPERVGIMEYLEDASRTDEHHVRVYESFDCWGFENVGSTMASYLPPLIAGMCRALESLKGLERDWNAVETKCVGLGDPYCEFKLVPGGIKELRNSLEKDSAVIEIIHERLMNRLMSFLIEGKPLVERPRLGSDVHFHPVFHTMVFPAIAGERFRMALRMGGSKSGGDVGERLMDAGIGVDEAVKRVLNLLEYCKVGKVSFNEKIRIRENCESFWSKFWSTPDSKEPSCFFTTGFLNGFFSAVKNQHVKETKCIAMGDPYCEWEFR